MKKLTLVVLSLVFIMNHAQAASKSTPRATESMSASSGPSNTHFGVGFSTFGGVPSAAAAAVSIAPALSGLLEFGSVHSLQMLASIASSSPFQFSVGGVYRANLAGDQNGGFHVGAGFNLGTVGAAAAAGTSFFLNIMPVAGFQFALGGAASNVKMHFDGGALFAITPSPFQFSLVPASALAGASIHYMF